MLKDSAQREMLVAAVIMKVIVDNRPLLLQDRRYKMTGKVLRKGNLPAAVVPLERDIKDVSEITSIETVRIGHVIIDILPCVKITLNRDANSVKIARMTGGLHRKPSGRSVSITGHKHFS